MCRLMFLQETADLTGQQKRQKIGRIGMIFVAKFCHISNIREISIHQKIICNSDGASHAKMM